MDDQVYHQPLLDRIQELEERCGDLETLLSEFRDGTEYKRATDRIGELEQEVAELTEQCQQHNTRQTNLHKQWREKYEKLRGALEKYGRHHYDCGLIPFDDARGRRGFIETFGKKECTCGLEQALKGGET